MDEEQRRIIEAEIKVYDREVLRRWRKDISVYWKQETKRMLDNARDNEEAFALIVRKMVGSKGNVARTVQTGNRDQFFSYMFQHYDDICNGTFTVLDVQQELNLGRNAPSYITKICHIINPKAYPLIWDTNVRAALHIGNDTEQFMAEFEAARSRAETLTDDEAYRHESDLWAGVTTEW